METAAAMGPRETTPASNDVLPPRIVLTWPLTCSSINKEQLVYAVASDDSLQVERVEFWIDDSRLGVTTTPPYQTRIDPGGFTSGIHSLKVRAFDAAGNVSVTTRRVVINKGQAGEPISCQ